MKSFAIWRIFFAKIFEQNRKTLEVEFIFVDLFADYCFCWVFARGDLAWGIMQQRKKQFLKKIFGSISWFLLKKHSRHDVTKFAKTQVNFYNLKKFRPKNTYPLFKTTTQQNLKFICKKLTDLTFQFGWVLGLDKRKGFASSTVKW